MLLYLAPRSLPLFDPAGETVPSLMLGSSAPFAAAAAAAAALAAAVTAAVGLDLPERKTF